MLNSTVLESDRGVEQNLDLMSQVATCSCVQL